MVKSDFDDMLKEMDKVKIMTKLTLIQVQLMCMTSKNKVLNNELEIIGMEIQEITDVLAK